MEDSLTEYRRVVAKVDDFSRDVAHRRRDAIQCGPGCNGCCQPGLTVSPVEAAALRKHLAVRPEQSTRLRAAASVRKGRCAMLQADGRCGVYDARPLVCRTQGMPLRYPQNFVPTGMLHRPSGRGGTPPPDAKPAPDATSDVMWCALNFDGTPPPAPDEILDAERVDALLALVNQRFCARNAIDPLSRIPLRTLL